MEIEPTTTSWRWNDGSDCKPSWTFLLLPSSLTGPAPWSATPPPGSTKRCAVERRRRSINASTIVCTAAAALLEIISDLIKESREEEEEEDSYVFRPSHQVRCYFFLFPIFKRSFDEGPAMDYYYFLFSIFSVVVGGMGGMTQVKAIEAQHAKMFFVQLHRDSADDRRMTTRGRRRRKK
jgi:hypothetical protein